MYTDGKDRQAGAGTVESDKARVSGHGRDIPGLNNLINSVPDIREFKVEEVLSAIENGTYNVKMEQVAEKIMGGNLFNEIF